MVQEAVTGVEVPFTNSITTRSAVKLDIRDSLYVLYKGLLKVLSLNRVIPEYPLTTPTYFKRSFIRDSLYVLYKGLFKKLSLDIVILWFPLTTPTYFKRSLIKYSLYKGPFNHYTE